MKRCVPGTICWGITWGYRGRAADLLPCPVLCQSLHLHYSPDIPLAVGFSGLSFSNPRDPIRYIQRLDLILYCAMQIFLYTWHNLDTRYAIKSFLILGLFKVCRAFVGVCDGFLPTLILNVPQLITRLRLLEDADDPLVSQSVFTTTYNFAN